ncbi:MAG TPA: hypothetical protein VGI12_02580 [Vicinamibacterales bacterium]|jgi:hypothetical protein
MSRRLAAASLLIAVGSVAAAQTPQPFPKPGTSKSNPPAAAQPAQTPSKPPVVAPPATQVAPVPPRSTDPPTAAMLGVDVYPGAEFLTSFDIGKGQRGYLFGTNAAFSEIVNYYRNQLKQKGDLIYDEPAIHEFDIGKFKEESMVFPPSVTVKDYAWGGSAGYLNPKRGKQPARFKTVIQIVPATL